MESINEDMLIVREHIPHPLGLPIPTERCVATERSLPLLQPYIGSPIAEEDADAEVASYAAFSNDMNLLVNPANEVLFDADVFTCLP